MPGDLTPAGRATGRGVLTVVPGTGAALDPVPASPRAEWQVGTWSFPGRRDQVREARAAAAAFAAGSPVADDVVLCVSEMAANAVLHSRSGEPGGRFLVRVEVHAPEYTWVEVEDGGGPWQTRAADSLTGHGLDIVGKLADWGVDGGLGGWIVWARLDWARP